MASFDAFVSALDYPMLVVTTATPGERAGCLVGFATQASIDPARFLVGISDKNRTFRVAAGATHLAVHLLRRDQHALAALFGGETGDDTDKFAQCRWHDGPGAVPVLDDAPAWFVGTVLERWPMGDHVGFLLEPRTAGGTVEPFTPLTLSQVDDLEPGHDA